MSSREIYPLYLGVWGVSTLIPALVVSFDGPRVPYMYILDLVAYKVPVIPLALPILQGYHLWFCVYYRNCRNPVIHVSGSFVSFVIVQSAP